MRGRKIKKSQERSVCQRGQAVVEYRVRAVKARTEDMPRKPLDAVVGPIMAVRRKPSKRSDHGLRLIATTARSDCVPKKWEAQCFLVVKERGTAAGERKAHFVKPLVWRFRRFRAISRGHRPCRNKRQSSIQEMTLQKQQKKYD